MNKEELVESLKFFGLEKHDAEMYMGLLQAGSISIGNLATRLEMDRGKAYRTLKNLRNIGIVTTTFSNPTICTALKPKDALAVIIEKKQDEIVAMENISRNLISELDVISRNEVETEVSSFSIMQGRLNNYSKIAKIISDAKNDVFVVTTIEDVARMYHTVIPEKIIEAQQRGVEIRVLTDIHDDNQLPILHRINATEVKIGKLPSKSRLVVEKNNQLLMSGALNNGSTLVDERDSMLITDSSEMISNMYSLCQLLWKKSKPLPLFKKKPSKLISA